MTLLTAAHAQFAVSVHLGGSYTTSLSTYSVNHTGVSPITLTDTTYAVDRDPYSTDTPLDLTGGIKIGYQFGRLQIGISGNFSYSQVHGDFSPAQYNQHNYNRRPDTFIPETWEYDNYVGEYLTRQTSFVIAPYARYEIIQLGDVAFFLELDAFYTKVNKPKRHEFIDFYHAEMHHTFEHDSIVQSESSSFGAQITPGLSWQLSEHCGIDLYFDLMSLAFIHNESHNVLHVTNWDMITNPPVISNQVTTTTHSSTNNLGFETAGVPGLNGHTRNWVRVGFNYTF